MFVLSCLSCLINGKHLNLTGLMWFHDVQSAFLKNISTVYRFCLTAEITFNAPSNLRNCFFTWNSFPFYKVDDVPWRSCRTSGTTYYSSAWWEAAGLQGIEVLWIKRQNYSASFLPSCCALLLILRSPFYAPFQVVRYATEMHQAYG